MDQDNFVDSEYSNDGSEELEDPKFGVEENLFPDTTNKTDDSGSISARCKDEEREDILNQSEKDSGIIIEVTENGDMVFSPYQSNNINLWVNEAGDMVVSAPDEDLDIFVADTGDILITSSVNKVQEVEITMDPFSKQTIMQWKGKRTKNKVILSQLPINVVSKFEQAIAAFPIVPYYQDLTRWRIVMEWSDLLPPSQLAHMLAQSFFPRWLHVLSEWVDSVPNYEDVVVWYSCWKSCFPPSVLLLPSVAGQLVLAHTMMDRVKSSDVGVVSEYVDMENDKL